MLAPLIVMVGCDFVEWAPPGRAYEACAQNVSHPNCAVGTSCEDSPVRVAPNSPPARICSVRCMSDRDCPNGMSPSGVAHRGVCSVASGFCFQRCDIATDCALGTCTTVADVSGTVCVPDNTPTRQAHQRCTRGTDQCLGATSCIAANASTDATAGSSGTHCSSECGAARPCSNVGTTAWGVACVERNGSAQCYERCDPGINCPSGFDCVRVTSVGGFVCLPPPQ